MKKSRLRVAQAFAEALGRVGGWGRILTQSWHYGLNVRGLQTHM